MRIISIIITTLALVIAPLHLEGEIATYFIEEIFITGVLELLKTLFNKHSAYYF